MTALCAWEQADKTDYQERFIEILNIRLQETFELNNACRLKKGREKLEEAQQVRTLGDELTYESEVLRAVLPVGIAGYLYVDDDETGISNVYREDYLRMLINGAGFARATEAEMEW